MGKSVRELKALLVKVLQFETDESSHHIRYFLKINGRIIARTHISHSRRGNDQIDDNMLKLHAVEMQCSLQTLKSLLENPKLRDAYFSELFQKGLITQEQYEGFCRKKNSTK